MTGRPRRKPTLALTVLAGLLAAAGACFSERASVTGSNGECSLPVTSPIFGSTRALIAIRSFAFQPDTIRVQPGSVVTWVNCEPGNEDAHTSTSDDQVWDSPIIAPGETYTRTFSVAGTFDYLCGIHPSMRGTVIVE